MIGIKFPYSIDARGRTEMATHSDHVRDLIELVLFTSPGERVNRPSFGTGLLRYVFEPNDSTLAAALQTTAQASLQYWLGSLIVVRNLEIQAVESTLVVTVQYVLTETGEGATVEIRRAA